MMCLAIHIYTVECYRMVVDSWVNKEGEKRGEHPVVDEELASRARVFRILTGVTFVVLIVIIVLAIVL